jgi:GTP-binding protein EngB required for normal cell division
MARKKNVAPEVDPRAREKEARVAVAQRDLEELTKRLGRSALPPRARTLQLLDGAAALHALGIYEGEAGAAFLSGLGEARARVDEPPSIALVGMFNAGKSSVVNALLGDDIAVVDVQPTTAVSASYSRGPEARVELLRDDAWQRVSLDEYRSITHVGALRDAVGEVKSVRVVHPNVVLDGLVLIDTPGFRSSERSGKDDETRARDEMDDAGAFVWVVDCNRGLQRSDLDVLARFPRDGRLRYALLNKADQKTPRERREILDTFQKQHGADFDGVFLYSASLRRKQQRGDTLSPALLEHLELDWDRRVLPAVRAASDHIRARAVAKQLQECLEPLLESRFVALNEQLELRETLDELCEKSLHSAVHAINALGVRVEKELSREVERFIRTRTSKLQSVAKIDKSWFGKDPEIDQQLLFALRDDALATVEEFENRVVGIVDESFERRRSKILESLKSELSKKFPEEFETLSSEIAKAGEVEVVRANAIRVPVAVLRGRVSTLELFGLVAHDEAIEKLHDDADLADALLTLVFGEEDVVSALRASLYGSDDADGLSAVDPDDPGWRTEVERGMQTFGFPLSRRCSALEGEIAANAAARDFLERLNAAATAMLGSLDMSERLDAAATAMLGSLDMSRSFHESA